ncbi:MAG: methyltransferase domain-containing protein [Nitrospinota bacterium]|nr:methyltransferase domain-containing protein [Nitrospinota bacterium]
MSLDFPYKKILLNILAFLLVTTVAGVPPLDAKPRDQERWDQKYGTEAYIFGKEPVPFLKQNIHLLPKGKALDIAMGEGRNGVYLATQGYEVVGLDISPKGLEKAHQLAKLNGVTIETRVVDLESHQLEKNAYDVILLMYYMQRDLWPQINDALKPGGMAVIETYNVDHLKHQKFNPKWLLKTNELLEAFRNMKIIRYQAYEDSDQAYSSIIVQKVE